MRFAIYFTPAADHPLTRAAAGWLGRDAFTGAAIPRTGVAGFTAAELDGFTAEPARYGFHGTVVAPFHLAEGIGETALDRAAAGFAASRQRFVIPRLAIRRIGHFFALVPSDALAAMDDLAAKAVQHFSLLRAPLDDADIARRRPDTLSERQRDYLLRYGYPYVFEEFRFHMTLTGPVPAGEAPRVAAALEAVFRPLLGTPLEVSSLAVFVEAARGAPFTVRGLHPLAALARKSA